MNIQEIKKLSLYNRTLLQKLNEWLDSDETLIITGSRQVGKTSLLFLLIQELLKKKVSDRHIYYFDLEDFDILDLCNQGTKNFVHHMKTLGEDFKSRVYVFFDEIQYLENPSNFLKLLHDHYKKIKTVCSGSSTLDIRRKFKDSLVGRKIVFELYPLTFKEFLLFKKKNDLLNFLAQYSIKNIVKEQQPDAPSSIVLTELEILLNEYIRFGGYPAVAKIDGDDKKRVLLNEIYQTYVRRDINQLFSIENVSAFNRLVGLLGFQIGQLVNLQELSINISSARQTLQNYLFILENTFILRLLSPFYTNKRKELVKMPKVYFLDSGLRNQIVKNTTALNQRPDAGALIENFAFQQIIANLRIDEDLKFWRTQSGNEVDFVIESNELIPIEIKYKPFQKPQIPTGIRFFIQNYNCKNAFVVTKNYFGKTQKNGCDIYFLPVMLFGG